MGRKFKDYTGEIHGCWKVIKRDLNPQSKSHETFWICECQTCKTISSVRKYDLDKNPQSCNNCKGEIISQKLRIKDSSVWRIGDKYGLLTIVGKGNSHTKHTYVKVQCDCGSPIFEVRLEHLRGQGGRGRTISCGCATESSGEIKIRKILEQTDYNWQKQYRIKNNNNEVMVFDFVIFDNQNNIKKCIEYNGEQHYKPVELFGGEKAFQEQKERDERKRKWCKENNIELLEIPYIDYDNISLEYLFSDFPNS